MACLGPSCGEVMRGSGRLLPVIAVVATLITWGGPASADQTNPPPTLDNNSASALQSVTIPAEVADSPASGRAGSVAVLAKRLEYRTLAPWAAERISDTVG